MTEAGATGALSTQQGLVALYVLQDIARVVLSGSGCGADWIKRHNVLGGLVGDNRKNVLRLARWTACLACGSALSHDSSGDHVIALACGGPAGAENFLPLCGRCNSSKGKHDLLAWWHAKKRSALELPPDVLCVYTRLTFAHQRRLGALNRPAPDALNLTVDTLLERYCDSEQEWMLRQRVSWLTGERW